MHKVILYSSVLINSAPDLFKDYFIRSSHNIIIYSNRRNGLDLLIPKVHIELAKKSCFYSGALAFNNLLSFFIRF